MMGPSAGADSDVKGLFALLEILSDPEKAKKKLEEFAKASVEAKSLMEKAQEKSNRNSSFLETLVKREVQVAKEESLLEDRLSEYQRRKEDLNKERRELDTTRTAFLTMKEEMSKALEEKAKELKKQEETLIASLSRKEKELSEQIMVTTSQSKEYTGKLAAFKALVR